MQIYTSISYLSCEEILFEGIEQCMMDTLKADLVKVAQGADLEASENRENWREIVESENAMNGL